jgi:hypothetical protein
MMRENSDSNKHGAFSPAMVMDLPVFRIFGSLCSGIWIMTLVVNFVLLFRSELARLHERQQQDVWLLLQCEDPVFAARMQPFNDPCGLARHRGQVNIHLMAFHQSLDNLFLCGSYSCEGLVWMVVERVRSNMVAFVVLLVVLVILFPMMILPFWKRWTDHIGETHVRNKFNMPYGYNSALVHSGYSAAGYQPMQYQQPGFGYNMHGGGGGAAYGAAASRQQPSQRAIVNNVYE